MLRRAKKTPAKAGRESHLVPDVRDQRRLIQQFLNTVGANGKKIGSVSCGVYAFFDYDGAAIYVGQTKEKISTRIRRHMTNRRTDAVAMKVLDPMEVASIQVWPFVDLQKASKTKRTEALDAAEYTVYLHLKKMNGTISDILNEKLPPKRPRIRLPKSYRASIVEPSSSDRLYHPDERIARRASTIAALAQIVKERDVNLGLRRTLVTQAGRLHRLAQARFEALASDTPAEQAASELFGPEDEE